MFISAYTTAANSSLPQPDTSGDGGSSINKQTNKQTTTTECCICCDRKVGLTRSPQTSQFSVDKQIDERLVIPESHLYFSFHKQVCPIQSIPNQRLRF